MDRIALANRLNYRFRELWMWRIHLWNLPPCCTEKHDGAPVRTTDTWGNRNPDHSFRQEEQEYLANIRDNLIIYSLFWTSTVFKTSKKNRLKQLIDILTSLHEWSTDGEGFTIPIDTTQFGRRWVHSGSLMKGNVSVQNQIFHMESWPSSQQLGIY